jgi:hypothetical protein
MISLDEYDFIYLIPPNNYIITLVITSANIFTNIFTRVITKKPHYHLGSGAKQKVVLPKTGLI